ncbi:uncharacterized protein LOC116196825 [Punica granatum]|uniref:IST1-like protein n=2 Tax=Punica granatum TaxID=22663 RepID=A0A218X0V6_PUNGR|nr:uncharacterized protein LOC116196825 [Punica granatum]OWM78637.1 hypothetical protein CDL15_Pgr002808 [Punica granatum]PKI32066.1 hypothetical protein CRG98_047538 [Punica granatum]
MFDILFGWRKASKCKRLIRRVQCRLKLLKNKRYSIVRQLREDVAQLIKTGYEEIAIDRAEQLFKDESIMAVYELLDHFCEFILIHLSYIRRNRDCPNDINEAVSSLVFASARCGDLPELRAIRKLFGERYGDNFTKRALELYPGNLVNHEIRDKLSIKSVPGDVKRRLMDEISCEYCLQTGILALEYTSELQKQMKEIMEPQVIDTDAQFFPDNVREPKFQVLDTKGAIETKSALLETETGNELMITQIISSFGAEESQRRTTLQRASECKEKVTVTSSSSSGNSPQFYRENIVFLDDVEEVQSSLKVNGNSQDQRLFKFKPSPVPRIETIEDGYLEESDSGNGSPVSRASTKSKTGHEKRIRRRTLSRDSHFVESIDFVTYYNGPNKNRTNQERNKHQKKNTVHASDQPLSAEKKLEQSAEHSMNSCCKAKDCSLEHPCYHHVANEGDSSKDTLKQESESVSEVKLPLKQERVCHENVAVVYDVFTYPSNKPNKRNIGSLEQKEEGFISDLDSSSSGEDGQGLPAYLRALTMPPERPKEIREKIPRSNSYPIQYPHHVHPKLPDYDEIAAKFMALKKDHMQGKDQCKKQDVH